MKRLICFLVIIMATLLVLSACTPSSQAADTRLPTAASTLTPTHTQQSTLTPTITPSPTATITLTPTPRPPWMGMLYHDENYSGTRDPDEPALAGYPVCIVVGYVASDKDDCGITDHNGGFNIPNTSQEEKGTLTFTDSNQGSPQALTRFIQLMEEITVPAYDGNGVKIPEQNLKYFEYPTGYKFNSGEMREIGLVQSAPLHTCPVDMDRNGAHISTWYSESHKAIDIAANYGTHLFSPGKCNVTKLWTESSGSNNLTLRCGWNPTIIITYGHNDFSNFNFDTPDWYRISKDKFYDENGTLLRGYSAQPAKNSSVFPGQELHLYLGNTGKSNAPHVHIVIDDMKRSNPNPLEYLDCAKK